MNETGDPRVQQLCAEVASLSPARLGLISELTQTANPQALGPLLQVIAQPDHPNKVGAELAFFHIVSWPQCADEARRLILPLLTDQRLGMRLFAANAMRTAFGKDCADVLRSWMNDREFVVRLTASRLLDKLGLQKDEFADIQCKSDRPFCFSCGESMPIAPLPEWMVTPSAAGQFPIQPAPEDRPRAGSVCVNCDRILCWTCLGGAEVAICPDCEAPFDSATLEACAAVIERIKPYCS